MSLTLEWRHRIMAWRHELPNHLFRPVSQIPLEAMRTKAQLTLEEALNQDFEPVDPGTLWGDQWEYGWFKADMSLPKTLAGQMIALRMDVGAEALVYLNGEPAGAVDEHHQFIFLSDSAEPGVTYAIVLEAYAGHGPRLWRTGPTPPDRDTVPVPEKPQCTVGESVFGIWQEDAYQLMLDVETLWELREKLDPESLRVMEIDQGLRDFTLLADFEQPNEIMLASLRKCREHLQPLFEKRNGDTTPEMVGFGHAHIDVAWLWPLQETVRKCARTFSTQLSLMRRYPDYKFLQSQPQLYLMVKEYYPELYQRIKTAVDSGQWIPEGAAWVEPDTNITGGESLIRQLIHGKRFFEQEFGVKCELLWLPDVFGYSAALPQIMLGCKICFFSTQKIFWNYHGGEPFPYNTFIWEGLDGSRVKAHFHNDYNAETKPSNVIERWKERVQKDGFSKRLYPFGWGDGGGGPTRDHLEFVRRERDLEGMPKFRMDHPLTFFHEQEKEGWPSERYVGELYFQAHRGTYTSQARTKALNRSSEFALREAEFWGTLAKIVGNFKFPYQLWDRTWKTLLMNQFHDILPGSSIQRVYEEAEVQLAEVIDTADQISAEARKSLLFREGGLTAFNSLSWERTELITLPEDFTGVKIADRGILPVQVVGERRVAEVTVPACGWVSLVEAEPKIPENNILVSNNSLENNLIKVEIDELGKITSIFDKVNSEELVVGFCNEFKMYQDIPSAFDAWDIDSMVRQTPVDLLEAAEIEVLATGPIFGQLGIKRKLHNSSMTQTITLRRNSRRVDFHTVMDWQERHKLLKVDFPVRYHTPEALHEIQFGYISRPTHGSRQIDKDRFEVPCQKWSALVEENRGFAVLNDSKYGVAVQDNSIQLSLLKSALAPDQTADRGRQEFTYAFYFWDKPFYESGLIQEGYNLNVPISISSGQRQSGSLFTLDKANIILETLKPAEDSSTNDIVVRFYEAAGTRTTVKLKIGFPVQNAFLADMLENALEELKINGSDLSMAFNPFEIKTLRLVPGG